MRQAAVARRATPCGMAMAATRGRARRRTAELGPVRELDQCANPSARGGSDGVEVLIADLRGGGQGFGDPRPRRLSCMVGAGHVATVA